MQRRMIVLAAGAVIVLGALLLLVFKINSSPEHAPPADELAKARNAYNQRAKAQPALPATVTNRATTSSTRRRPVPPPSKRDEPETRPAPPSIPARRLPAVGAGAMSARINVSQGDSELKKRMARANRLYDRGAYEDARDAALEVLKGSPRNIRMLRIVVSTACIMGDDSSAKKYAAQLPRRDFQQMQRRCSHYQITL